MRVAYQIFRKDAERLWLPVLLTWALLGFWAFHEANPAPFVWPGTPQNNWLNTLLPFVWGLLIALIIQQDSLVGDRQFWLTLPCGWRPLMLAKLAFIAASIQLPYFVASAAILMARDFNPILHMPHLFWKQLVVLGLIVPATAAAAVVRNVTQFVLLLITVASALVLFSDDLSRFSRQDDLWDVRWLLAVLTLGVGGLLIVCLQFVRRYTTPSRVLGAATAIAAFSLSSWLPRDLSAAISAAMSPAPATRGQVTVQLSPREPDRYLQQAWYNFQRTTVVIPLTISGLPPDSELDQISLQLIREGEVFEAQWRGYSAGVRRDRIQASLDASWQKVDLYSPAEWTRLRSGPVTLRGRVLARLYVVGRGITVPPGEQRTLEGAIHCSNIFREASLPNMPRVSTLECESPEALPQNLLSRFNDAPRRPVGRGILPNGQDQWLSPIYRARNSVGGVNAPLTLSVAPRKPLGSVIVDYTIPNLDLNRFVVHEPAKAEAPR